MNSQVIVVCCILMTLIRCDAAIDTNLRTSERINNFTLELLYFTASERESVNIIISPLAVWTTLATLAEGASDITYKQISLAIRLPRKREIIRKDLNALHQNINAVSPHFAMTYVNAIFIDRSVLPENDFNDISAIYNTSFTRVDLANPVGQNAVNTIQFQNKQLNIADNLSSGNILPYNGLYFRGIWMFSFDKFFTTKQSFYDDNGKKLGKIDMMYNRHTFLCTNIDILKARALELPLGTENKFSMIILLPYAGVPLRTVFLNFASTSVNEVFDILKRAKDDPEDILVVIPILRVKTSIDIKSALNSMGVYSLFDTTARLPHIARLPTYAKKYLHDMEINISEEGINTSPAMENVIGTRVGGASIILNRPFMYFVVEKVTNTILYSGLHKVPT